MKPVFHAGQMAIALSCLGGALASSAWAQRSDVRIYRCTDAKGSQSLRDSPCPPGQKEQARDMLRPKDAPSAVRVKPAAQPPAPAAPIQVVYLVPPQSLYECVTPDGSRYTSENGDGNPRWVPLWTLGEPYFGRPPAGALRRGTFRTAESANASIGRPQQQLPTPTRIPAPPRGHGSWPTASGGGTWVNDACSMLPQAEVCARQRDRRDEIRSRFFQAMPSERDVLRVEERGINARLDNDCGGR